MKQSAFTIVELIIVVAVIGILATITLVSYRSVQQSASLAKVQTDLAAINDGIKIFQAKNGSYPVQSSPLASCANHGVFTGVVGDYIDTVPPAPCTSASNSNDTWMYWSDGADYKLIHIRPASIEAIKDQIPSELRDTRYTSNSPTGSWGYWSPGAVNW